MLSGFYAFFYAGHVTCYIWLWLDNSENLSHGKDVAKHLVCGSQGFQDVMARYFP